MKPLLFFILFIFCSSAVLAAPEVVQLQEEQEAAGPVPLDFDQEKIHSYKQDPDFDYTEKIESENWWTRFKRWVALQWQNFMERLFGDFEAPPFLAFLFRALPYLLITLLLGLIIYLFWKLNPASYFSGHRTKPAVFLDEDEKIIRKRDIKVLIENAIAKGNYRLAVRYHFLYMLQQLTQRNFISYDSSKTDEDYLQELLQPELREQFRKLNRIYDFVWYGRFETGPENFEKIRKDFQKMQTLISPSYEQKL